MKKITSGIMVFIILGTFLIAVNPVSAGTIHVYPGDDIVAKIGAAESGDTVYGLQLGGTNSLIKNISVSGNKMLADTSFYGISLVGENSFGEHSSIINCTVSNNALGTNTTGEELVFGICAYVIFISVENCIVTSNTASDALTPVYGIWVPKLEGYNLIKYSNSWNNKDNWGQAFGRLGPGAEPGEGCISADPIFTKGPLGDFYLSNSSPCVDSGSDLATNHGLSTGFTTNIKGVFDTGTVDMGYHYSSNGGSETQYLPVGKIIKILKENQEE